MEVRKPEPIPLDWTHDDEYFTRTVEEGSRFTQEQHDAGIPQKQLKRGAFGNFWLIPQDMGNLYINWAIVGPPWGGFQYDFNDDGVIKEEDGEIITDFTHGWSNRFHPNIVGKDGQYLPKLIDDEISDVGIDSAKTELMTSITAVEEYATTEAYGLAETTGNSISIGSDTTVGAAE